VLAKIAQVLGDNNVSIETALQQMTHKDYAELVFGIYQVKEKNMRDALKKIEDLDVVIKIGNILRVEG
jgi:ACT domain-containing protein